MHPVSVLTGEHSWMKSVACQTLMKALNDGADRPQALFVGGCVRNALIGVRVDDVDIATQHSPKKVMQTLQDTGFKCLPTGIDHGTITAIKDKEKFEITTLRKDVETDGRHAVVAFSKCWREDAQRRDFTMNTLLADGEGHIYDPLGRGLEDLNQRNVIFVGEPSQRIAEDHLRILRFFRFHALYGAGEPDRDALKACKNAADKIVNLSKERVTQEFFKILSAKNAADILQLMFDNNILIEFKFGTYRIDELRNLCEFQSRYGLEFLAARLWTLSAFRKENFAKLDKRLLIPKILKKDIAAIDGVLNLSNLENDHNVKVAIYKFGRIATAQSLIIELITDRVMNGYAPKALEIIQKWDVPNFPLSGENLLQEGFEPGPDLGRELVKREEVWINNGFKGC